MTQAKSIDGQGGSFEISDSAVKRNEAPLNPGDPGYREKFFKAPVGARTATFKDASDATDKAATKNVTEAAARSAPQATKQGGNQK